MKKFLLTGLMFTNTFVFADDFKLGYIDVNKVFTTAKPAVALQAALKNKFAPEQQQLQKMNDNLISEQKQMQAIMAKAPSMDKLSPTDRENLQKLESTFQKDQMAFQQRYYIFQQKLQRSQEYASSVILGHANNILKDISDKGGYDLVMTSNQLVYAKPKYDLTDQVIQKLNAVDSTDMIKKLKDLENQPVLGPDGKPILTNQTSSTTSNTATSK